MMSDAILDTRPPQRGGANFECPPFPPRKGASLLKAGDGSRDRLGFRHSDKK